MCVSQVFLIKFKLCNFLCHVPINFLIGVIIFASKFKFNYDVMEMLLPCFKRGDCRFLRFLFHLTAMDDSSMGHNGWKRFILLIYFIYTSPFLLRHKEDYRIHKPWNQILWRRQPLDSAQAYKGSAQTIVCANEQIYSTHFFNRKSGHRNIIQLKK